jgi:putative transposase
MQRFKLAGPAQRFLSIHVTLYNQFAVQRYLISRCTLRTFRATAFNGWCAVVPAS